MDGAIVLLGEVWPELGGSIDPTELYRKGSASRPIGAQVVGLLPGRSWCSQGGLILLLPLALS